MTEQRLHKQITDWIKLQYPKAIFNTDSSGVRLTIGQAKKLKQLRSGNGFPDIQILEVTDNHNGLFLEVKKESPYKLNGELKKNAHLEKQHNMHNRLRIRGYKVAFVWSLDQAIQIINEYMNNVIHKVA